MKKVMMFAIKVIGGIFIFISVLVALGIVINELNDEHDFIADISPEEAVAEIKAMDNQQVQQLGYSLGASTECDVFLSGTNRVYRDVLQKRPLRDNLDIQLLITQGLGRSVMGIQLFGLDGFCDEYRSNAGK